MKVKYELIHKDKKTGARYGKLIFTDKNGLTYEYETPMFMPVGTQATVKTLSPEQVKACNPGIILSNTYHLWLRPTPEIVDQAGTKFSVLLETKRKILPKKAFISSPKLMAAHSSLPLKNPLKFKISSILISQ